MEKFLASLIADATVIYSRKNDFDNDVRVDQLRNVKLNKPIFSDHVCQHSLLGLTVNISKQTAEIATPVSDTYKDGFYISDVRWDEHANSFFTTQPRKSPFCSSILESEGLLHTDFKTFPTSNNDNNASKGDDDDKASKKKTTNKKIKSKKQKTNK